MSTYAAGQIVARVGPVAVSVAGASAAATTVATVIVATGAAVALAAAGVGVYHWLKGRGERASLPPSPGFGLLADED